MPSFFLTRGSTRARDGCVQAPLNRKSSRTIAAFKRICALVCIGARYARAGVRFALRSGRIARHLLNSVFCSALTIARCARALRLSLTPIRALRREAGTEPHAWCDRLKGKGYAEGCPANRPAREHAQVTFVPRARSAHRRKWSAGGVRQRTLDRSKYIWFTLAI